MIRKSGDRLPACAKPEQGPSMSHDASAGVGRSDKDHAQTQGSGLRPIPKLVARPLRPDEREIMAHALVKAGLPADDLEAPGRLFWRFETLNQLLAGFGGLEIAGQVALLRSLVTLPPLRGRGIGRAIVI